MKKRTVRTSSKLPASRPRVAALVDLENVLAHLWGRPAADLREGLLEVVDRIRSEGDVVSLVGVGNAGLCRDLVSAAAACGLRLFTVAPGPDAADTLLLELASGIPRSATLLLIASGDHAFAPLARSQRESGRRVVVVAPVPPTSLAAELYAAADSVSYPRPTLVPVVTASSRVAAAKVHAAAVHAAGLRAAPAVPVQAGRAPVLAA